MSDAERKRSCFVIMPFGEKTDFDGRAIDFDDIYRFFFKKAIEDLGIECIRCDEIEEAGSIHDKMFEQIYQADVVVVDITTSNANVYYELGIRHALAKGVTLLIRRKGTRIPFNIQGLQVVEYDQEKFASIERAKSRIHQIIKNGLNSRISDSPVHDVLELNIEPEAKRLGETRIHEFRLGDATDMLVGLITGDIQDVTSGVDVWVNTENTHMQMARPFDNSISGIIRYLGMSKRDGEREDLIAQALAEAKRGRDSVDAAEVLITTSGELERSHQVKRIFHVASHVGQVGRGYMPIADVPRCVSNVLNAVTRSPRDDEGNKLESILIPLIGTRLRRGTVDGTKIKALLDRAINHLSQTPTCGFRKVYFLNYTDQEFEICYDILSSDNRLIPTPSSRTGTKVSAESPSGTGDGSSRDASSVPGSSLTSTTAKAAPALNTKRKTSNKAGKTASKRSSGKRSKSKGK